MQKLISFMRRNKAAQLLVVLLIALSIFALWAHHHEADHGLDCSVCHAVQALVIQIAGLIVFFWVASVRPRQVFLSEAAPLFSLFHGATLCNRAPPIFA